MSNDLGHDQCTMHRPRQFIYSGTADSLAQSPSRALLMVRASILSRCSMTGRSTLTGTGADGQRQVSFSPGAPRCLAPRLNRRGFCGGTRNDPPCGLWGHPLDNKGWHHGATGELAGHVAGGRGRLRRRALDRGLDLGADHIPCDQPGHRTSCPPSPPVNRLISSRKSPRLQRMTCTFDRLFRMNRPFAATHHPTGQTSSRHAFVGTRCRRAVR